MNKNFPRVTFGAINEVPAVFSDDYRWVMPTDNAAWRGLEFRAKQWNRYMGGGETPPPPMRIVTLHDNRRGDVLAVVMTAEEDGVMKEFACPEGQAYCQFVDGGSPGGIYFPLYKWTVFPKWVKHTA